MKKPSASSLRQRGAALLVVLLLLLVMALLGIASMRSTLLQERMSGASYDRSLSFQAAESALRVGEAAVRANPDTACNGARCTAPPNADPVCGAGAGWMNAAVALTSNVVAPQYRIDFLGKAPPPSNPGCGLGALGNNDPCMVRVFLVTACSGVQGGDRAVTMLKSNFTTP